MYVLQSIGIMNLLEFGINLYHFWIVTLDISLKFYHWLFRKEV